MTVPAQNAELSIAPQAAKVGKDGSFTVGSYTWHRYRVPRLDGGAQEMQAMLPLELGNLIVGTGAYKYGAFYAIEADLIPRLENTFGFLLEGVLGNVSSVTSSNYTVSGFTGSPTGVNAHLFRFNPSDSVSLPWMAVRVKTPGATSDDVMGEVGYDCKINNLRLIFPGSGLATARFSVIGRQFFHQNASNTNAWAYNELAEDADTIVQTLAGSISLFDGTQITPTLTALSLDIVNNLTTPQQEMIIGSPYPDDFVPLTRSCQIRAVYKWSDPTLYRRIMNGGGTNLTWSSLPFVTETVGTQRAFAAEFQSPQNISGSSPAQPAKLKIYANKVTWQLDRGGISLEAGNVISLPFIGNVIDPGSGVDYLQIVLENAATSYAWS